MFESRKSMSSSQKNIIMIPRGVTSKSNLRYNKESLSKKSLQNIPRYEDMEKVPMKFKQIKQFNSSQFQENSQINELDTKYNVYKHGSPNFYSSSIETHKANILKNDIKSLDFPFIDRVIKQIKNTESKQNSLNLRDYQLYPNSIKNHLSHKFKDLLSDKQEIKDFLQWFNMSCFHIEQKDIPQVKKFQEKQIMISSGFLEIIQQLSKLSKTRSQIIKLLWNKQAQEMQQIVKHLTNKIIQLQKSHLIESTRTHEMYQKQIDKLKSQNIQLSQKLKRQTFLNCGYVNTFRINRKLIKKQQIALKKVLNLNQTIMKENINLIDINSELILSQSRKTTHIQLPKYDTIKTLSALQIMQTKLQQQKEKQLNNSQAKIILYRKMQIAQKKSCLQQNLNSIKSDLLHKIKQNSQKEVKSKQLSQYQLEQKKQSLYNYLIQRFQQNPNEKLIIGDDFLHQDDHQINIDQIQTAIQRILDSKNVQIYLLNQDNDIKSTQLCQI